MTRSTIVSLEEKLAHQAKTIDELSDTIARQWTEIDRMRQQLEALTKRFLELEAVAGPTPENTRPPHW